MGRRPKLYREYDEETGELIKLECSVCHETKDVSCFDKDKSSKDGVYTKCKQCRKKYRENRKEESCEYLRKWRGNHKEERYEYHRRYNGNHKEKINGINRRYKENKAQQEIIKIYENVTKHKYPNNGVQYGVIYGVVCNSTNRWYIGQTTTGFNTRYHGDFFNRKYNELSEDSIKGKLLGEDIRKYDQENFEIIEVLDVAFSEKELDEKEAYYIDLYKAYDEGYNSNRGNIFKHGKEKRSDNNEI